VHGVDGHVTEQRRPRQDETSAAGHLLQRSVAVTANTQYIRPRRAGGRAGINKHNGEVLVSPPTGMTPNNDIVDVVVVVVSRSEFVPLTAAITHGRPVCKITPSSSPPPAPINQFIANFHRPTMPLVSVTPG